MTGYTYIQHTLAVLVQSINKCPFNMYLFFWQMYGLLLESVKHSIIEQYGEHIWLEVKERAGVVNSFSTHQCYAENSFPAIVRCTHEVNKCICFPLTLWGFSSMYSTF